jgi:hypothetical protein
MERSEQIATQFFRQIGFAVEDIPESNEKRADIRAFDSIGNEYITEVKERLDNPETIAAQSKTILGGDTEFVFRVSPTGRSNRLDGIFKSAGDQLAQTPPSGKNAYRLLWLRCDGIDSGLKAIRARNTFYGIVPVAPNTAENGCMCFYFDFNSAYMLPHVNGLLILRDGGVILYVNEFSANVDGFRKSELVAKLGKSVFDPVDIRANDGHIAFEGNMTRKDDLEVLAALEKQTGIKYHTCRMQRYSF